MDPTNLDSATRFARSDQVFSQSPSHSPIRRQQLIGHEINPLLANLSPTSTLEALQSTNAVSAEAGSHKRALLDSVANVSTSDRAWGIKAALAGKKVREWYKELEAWPWPTASDGSGNGFEPFSAGGARTIYGSFAATTLESWKETKVEFWGHLPAHLVQECEDRIEIIKDDMEALELEELKEHVRSTHNLSGRKGSAYGQNESGHTGTHKHIDDATAIITTTIMQTLPHMSRLQSLLCIWSTRLAVLRQVPGLLECLERTQIAMNAAWDVSRPTNRQTSGAMTSLDRNTFETIRDVLEKQVLGLGRRLDCMLDALEGREDTLPDHWVDAMEALEMGFGTWVVETERLVFENELNAAGNTAKAQTAAMRKDMQFPSHITSVNEQKLSVYRASEDYSEEQSNSESQSNAVGNLRSRSDDNMTKNGIDDTENLSSEDPNRSQGHEMPRNVPSDPVKSQLDGAGELSSTLERQLASTSISTSDNPVFPRSVSPASSTQRQPFETSDTDTFDTYIPEVIKKHSDADTGVVARGRSTSRPTPLILKQPRDSMASNAASEFSSDISFPGSSTSDYFSDMSSPEIQQAFRAEYFGAPIEVTTPSFGQRDLTSPTDTVSRQSSQRTERGSRSMAVDLTLRGITSQDTPRSRASSFVPESTIPEDGCLADQWLTSRSGSTSHQRARSASMQSFAVVPRTEAIIWPGDKGKLHADSYHVQNITVKRSGSYANAPRTPPRDQGAIASYIQLPNSQASQSRSTSEYVASNGAPSGHDEDCKTGFSPSVRNSNGNDQFEPPPREPTVQDPSDHSTALLPLSTKSRSRFENITDLAPGSTPVKIRQRRKSDTSPEKHSARNFSPPRNDAKQLEARISSILTSIPAHIRLTSGPELDAPEVKPAAPDPRTPLPRSKTAPRLSHDQRSIPSPLPSLTLAPAQPRNLRPHPQSGDPEIKLYHLHQSGKEAPIKLFVRLVGEGGERVMVRIGGGWADLGEYLKEYANHHGKRSVSDSRFAIQEIPSSPVISPQAAGGASAPGSRPGSSYCPGAATPDLGALRQFEATPGSNSSIRPGSAHSWKEDESPLGGAGPKSKKVDVSPTKQAWVDGMLEQARHAVTAERKGDLGDLGKVGGIRRVYLRSKTAGV